MLHYANELLVRVRLPFKTFCKLAQQAETTRENVWEKSDKAYSSSIRVQTTIIYTFPFVFHHNINVKELFSPERELTKALRDTLT